MNVDAVIMDTKLIYSLASSVYPKSAVSILRSFIIMLMVTHLTFLGCLVCVRLYAKLFILH